MEVPFNPEREKRLTDVAATTGRAPQDIIEDALTAHGASRAARLEWSKCPTLESVPGTLSGAWVLRGMRIR
jgi:hypothetical protein